LTPVINKPIIYTFEIEFGDANAVGLGRGFSDFLPFYPKPSLYCLWSPSPSLIHCCLFSPVLDVECLSVNASVLQCPSDCLMLPGNLLLIVDSDAGLTLISLGDKQVQMQLAPKTGVWRNPECACLGGPDGQDVFVSSFVTFFIFEGPS
jgi:hypothetical protein